MKKSGLADSPFFSKPAPLSPVSEQVVIHEIPVVPSQDVFKRTDAQTHEHTNAQKQADAKVIERPLTRESFDIYEDQLEAFEQLRLRLKRERGRHIGKGELMRELLDSILLKK